MPCVCKSRRVASLTSSAAFATSQTESNPTSKSVDSTASRSFQFVKLAVELEAGERNFIRILFQHRKRIVCSNSCMVRANANAFAAINAAFLIICARESRTRIASVGHRLMQINAAFAQIFIERNGMKVLHADKPSYQAALSKPLC